MLRLLSNLLSPFKRLVCLSAAVLWCCLGCESPPRTFAGVEYLHETLSDPRRDIHLVKIQRNELGRRLRLELLFPPERLSAPALLSEIAERRATPPIAALNGTWLVPNEYWPGAVRGPLVLNGEVLHLTSEGHPADLGMNGEAGLWIATLHLNLEVRIDESIVLKSELNRARPAHGAVLYTLDEGVSQATTRTSGGIDYVLTAVPYGAPATLTLPHTPNDSPRRFIVERIVPNGNAQFKAGEAVLSIGAEHPAFSKLTAVSVGSSVAAALHTPIVKHFGACSPPAEAVVADHAQHILAAGTMLLEDPGDGKEPAGPSQIFDPYRAPRSALCWNDEELYLVAVDGFRFSLRSLFRTALGLDRSVGMEETELADYMRDSLRCRCGLMLDGGKTTALYVDSRIVNAPAAGVEYPTNAAVAVVPLP